MLNFYETVTLTLSFIFMGISLLQCLYNSFYVKNKIVDIFEKMEKYPNKCIFEVLSLKSLRNAQSGPIFLKISTILFLT